MDHDNSPIGQPRVEHLKSPSHASVTRREFLRATAGGLTALSASRVLGANERIGIGIIGFGLVGRIHTRSFLAQSDAEVVAIAPMRIFASCLPVNDRPWICLRPPAACARLTP